MSSATAMQTQTPENLDILNQAHEAITGADQMADSYAETAAEQQGRRFGNIGRAALATGLSVATLAGGALKADTAEASEPGKQEIPPTLTVKFKSENGFASVKASDVAKGKVTILANVSAKSIPKKQLRKLERNNQCRTFNGKKVDIKTKGLGVNGWTYGRDYRTSRFCKVNGQWKRVKCQNPSEIKIKTPPKPRPDRKVIFVRSNAEAKLSVKATSIAVASCKTADGVAYASAYARGDAKGSASMRTFVKTKGQSVIRVQGQADAEARTNAEAKVNCGSNSIEVTTVKPTPPPEKPPYNPPKKNLPPSVDLVGPQHIKTGGELEICAYGTDPEGQGDIVSRNFSETGNGNFITPVYSGDEAGEFCIGYKAGTTADNASVTATVRDTQNNSASDTESFPIDDSQDGEF